MLSRSGFLTATGATLFLAGCQGSGGTPVGSLIGAKNFRGGTKTFHFNISKAHYDLARNLKAKHALVTLDLTNSSDGGGSDSSAAGGSNAPTSSVGAGGSGGWGDGGSWVDPTDSSGALRTIGWVTVSTTLPTTLPTSTGQASYTGTAGFGGSDGGVELEGPTRIVRHPLPYPKCGGDIGAAGGAAAALYAGIQNNIAKFADNETLIAAWSAYGAGSILAEDFLGVLITVLGLSGLLELAVLAGLAAFTIYLVFACFNNG